MDWIIKIIQQLMLHKYTGTLEINFFKGGLTNVNVKYSMKEGDVLSTTETTQRLVVVTIDK